MADTDLIAFGMWSGITAVLMVITGFVYKSYQKKKSNQNFASSDDIS
jgi:hypothetical protein